MSQPSAHPNKAFWEAVALVALLLLILLFSVLHLGGWLGGGKEAADETIPQDVADVNNPASNEKDVTTTPAPGTAATEPAPDTGKPKSPRERPDRPPPRGSDGDDDDSGDDGGDLFPGVKTNLQFPDKDVNILIPEGIDGANVIVQDFERRDNDTLEPVELVDRSTVTTPVTAPAPDTPLGAQGPIVMSVRVPETPIPVDILGKGSLGPAPLSAVPEGKDFHYQAWTPPASAKMTEGIEEKVPEKAEKGNRLRELLPWLYDSLPEKQEQEPIVGALSLLRLVADM